AMYFVARYEAVLRALDELVSASAMALGGLDAKGLIGVAQARAASRPAASSTYSGFTAADP
ncbi:MAG: hypothetical protein ACK4N5_26890, partial [Myxococcales bacterium]